MTTAQRPDGAGPAAAPAAELIGRLRSSIDATILPLLQGVKRIALLDVPVHENIGDSAILMGTIAFLRRTGLDICYTCSIDTYSRELLAGKLGDGTIMLTGGGNLGDLWPHSERFRQRVLADFPDAPVLQLPQTVFFASERARDAARIVFDAHPRLTLLTRDTRSQEFVQANFRAPSHLCPDMAFAMGPLARRWPARERVVWLARRDRESAPGAFPVEHTTVDWLPRRPTRLARSERAARAWISAHPKVLRATWPALWRMAMTVGAQRVRDGCAIRANGQVVITDRLHGHILCLLLGIPHVVLDNSYGKVRQFYETWTRGTPLARWADTPAQALETATAWAG
jgi:pyruvyl transferase EpsO